jgi:hypothetical protein
MPLGLDEYIKNRVFGHTRILIEMNRGIALEYLNPLC